MTAPESKWPSYRRSLILGAALLGGMSIYSLLFGRPGDFGAGLLGGAMGGLMAAVVVIVELGARRLKRRQERKDL